MAVLTSSKLQYHFIRQQRTADMETIPASSDRQLEFVALICNVDLQLEICQESHGTFATISHVANARRSER